MWIGFSLSEKGLECGKNPVLLEKILSEIGGKPNDQVSNSVYDLIEICKAKPINPNYKDDFIKTLEEIAVYFGNKCYIATISLCGKILEICLIDILQRNCIDTTNIRMLGNMIRAVKNLPNYHIDTVLENIANLISICRNSAIHFNQKIPTPSRDQAIMVIFATRVFVNDNL